VILNISQPYRPPQPVTGKALPIGEIGVPKKKASLDKAEMREIPCIMGIKLQFISQYAN
jgi:hypothetical protein